MAWPYKSDPSCICKWIGVLQDVEKKRCSATSGLCTGEAVIETGQLM
jgi:hypothetical protein